MRMSDLMAAQLRDWIKQLTADIDSLEQGWLEMRRFRHSGRYQERSDKVEEAIELLRRVKTELTFELYGVTNDDHEEKAETVK